MTASRKKNTLAAMDAKRETHEWAHKAVRELLARCLQALEAEAALEVRMVKAARRRLGL
jgi:hypothetical protein